MKLIKGSTTMYNNIPDVHWKERYSLSLYDKYKEINESTVNKVGWRL